jgi:hypothetical protein
MTSPIDALEAIWKRQRRGPETPGLVHFNDNALANGFSRRYKWTSVYRPRPWRHLKDVEFAIMT